MEIRGVLNLRCIIKVRSLGINIKKKAKQKDIEKLESTMTGIFHTDRIHNFWCSILQLILFGCFENRRRCKEIITLFCFPKKNDNYEKPNVSILALFLNSKVHWKKVL